MDVSSALSAGGLEPSSVLALWTALLGSCLIGRTARRCARAWTPTERCLVIGAPSSADALEQKLGSSGVRASVVARISLEPGEGVDFVAAHPKELRDLVRRHDVHRVIIAPPQAMRAKCSS